MGFLLQYSCKKCDYKSPDFDNALIDPLGMPELYICSCDKCHSLFHRKENENKEVVDICPNCGNPNIKIHEDHMHIQCPNCGDEELHIECIGTFF